jgi:hypothetical protein
MKRLTIVFIMSLLILISGCKNAAVAPVESATVEPTAVPDNEPTGMLLEWNNAVIEGVAMLADRDYHFPGLGSSRYAPNEYLLLADGVFMPIKVIELDGTLYIPVETYYENLMEAAESDLVNISGGLYAAAETAASELGKVWGVLPGWGGAEKLFYPDRNVIAIAENPVVWIDDAFDASIGEGRLGELQSLMSKAYFALTESPEFENPEEWALERLAALKERIDNLEFIGQYGRFAIYYGPYITLLDVTTDEVYFFSLVHAAGAIWRTDFDNPELFLPMYFRD